MKKMLLILFALSLLAASLGACTSESQTSPTPAPNPNLPVSSDEPTPALENTPNPNEVIFNVASVDSITIQFLESFPLQVHVVAEGNLPDGCTEIYEAIVQRDGNTINVTLTTIRPTDAECTEALVPYQENIPLDVYGLSAGTYTVIVNGISASFAFAQDNSLAAEPDLPSSTEDGVEIEINPAIVYEIEVFTSDTQSGGPELIIRGAFNDGCTSLHSITDTLNGSTINVEVLSQRPTGMMCTQALVDFEEVYPLDSVTEAGTYSVVINGELSSEFTLQ